MYLLHYKVLYSQPKKDKHKLFYQIVTHNAFIIYF